MLKNDEFRVFEDEDIYLDIDKRSLERGSVRVAKIRERRWYREGSETNEDSDMDSENHAKETSERTLVGRDVAVKAAMECSDEEFIDVYGMNIWHSKPRLLRALKQFDQNVVELTRGYFQQAMNQIEEVVNKVIVALAEVNIALSFRAMTPECFYEVRPLNEVDIFLILDNISPDHYVLEDATTPNGYTRIRLSPGALNNMSVQGQAVVREFCTTSNSGESYLCPKKLCRKLASCVAEVAKETLEENATQYGRRVTFSDNSDFGVYTSSVSPYIVNLIPTLRFHGNWPTCASWFRSCRRKWPDGKVKDQILKSGIHLVGVPLSKEGDDLWKFLFCDARRRLIHDEDVEWKGRCLRILKVIVESDLCRPKGLLPSHLENILMWASRKYSSPRDWAEEELPQRFLEILAALHKCLENGDCHDFFMPSVNMFADLNGDTAAVLASKVKDVMIDPYKYLAFHWKAHNR